jgi:hypothetical protein
MSARAESANIVDVKSGLIIFDVLISSLPAACLSIRKYVFCLPPRESINIRVGASHSKSTSGRFADALQ